MRWRSRRRAVLVCLLLTAVFTGFSARLIHLQISQHEEFAELAAQKHSIRQIIPASRGRILDRNGEILAASVPIQRVIVDCSHVKNAAALAAAAAPFLNRDAKELEARFQTGKKMDIIEPRLAEETAVRLQKALQEKSLRGLYFEQATERAYPNGPMLSHVLGFLGRKQPTDEVLAGVEGIERSMEGFLHGQDGFRHIERDRTGRELVIYRGQERPPQNGLNVELTIDMGLQAILEGELESACADLKPQTATGIIVNPHTGEILAMACRPTFDPNDLNSTRPEQMKNRAIMDMVEPGSTFKTVVAGGALNEKAVNASTRIFCENGRFLYAGRILRDHHGYGHMTVREILVKSSNIGSAKMALLLGDEKFYEYVRRFGYGTRTGVDLPGEIPGVVHPPERWDKLTITRMPMGHSVAVTPLQIVMGMAVIANGGKLMAPRIIHAVRDSEGRTVQEYAPEVVNEVIPKDVADYVGAALTDVTGDEGTAKLARVNGFTVAGKTGTAQKVDPRGGYAPGKYVVSFVGYLPAEDPQMVCLILIDDAKVASNLNYGGLVAAPIFSRVAEKAARYLDLIPSPKAEPVLPVALRESPTKEVRR